jgi:hypothetical protein
MGEKQESTQRRALRRSVASRENYGKRIYDHIMAQPVEAAVEDLEIGRKTTASRSRQALGECREVYTLLFKYSMLTA